MGEIVYLLILAVVLYWLIPIILIIVGLVRIRSRPENAKKLLIVAGILLLVGAGFCGALLS
jgi:amino acid transporter